VSVEFLVLIAVVLLLPLIQFVVRAVREADRRITTELPRPAANQSATQQARRRRPEEGSPEAPQLSAEFRHTSSNRTAMHKGRPLRRDDTGEPATSRQTAGESVRRPLWAMGVSSGSGLRRAIVLLTILGPCRANDPYARSEDGPS
jgi:hypothetical protein